MTELRRGPRRRDALSRERIVEAAIEILDAEGEAALTFKVLTARLSTGAGAIYHHVANKAELLSTATDQVVGQALGQIVEESEPVHSLRTISLAIFDAIDAHPWVGAQLTRNPYPTVVRLWTAIGRQLQSLGVTGATASNAGSTLVNYILGSAAQHAAGPQSVPDNDARTAYLNALAEQLTQDDSDPLVHEIASNLQEHDDRAQFLAGVEIFLTGIANW